MLTIVRCVVYELRITFTITENTTKTDQYSRDMPICHSVDSSGVELYRQLPECICKQPSPKKNKKRELSVCRSQSGQI